MLKAVGLFVLALTVAPLFAFAKITAREFVSHFNAYYENKPLKTVPRESLEYEYVFVAGFLNEVNVHYFKDNIDALRKFGVPATQIHVLEPKSNRTVPTSIPLLANELEMIYERHRRPLVLISHSKGAAETFGVILTNSDFIRRAVKNIFLIQGALGGSGIADYICGEGPEVDERMPLTSRLLLKVIGRSEKLLAPIFGSAIQSLTRSSISSLWQEYFETYGFPAPDVSEKIHYVLGRQTPHEMSELLEDFGWYLQTYYGPNDGVVALADQSLPNIGTAVALVNADHFDLLTSWPIGNAPKKLRHSLIYSILQTANK